MLAALSKLILNTSIHKHHVHSISVQAFITRCSPTSIIYHQIVSLTKHLLCFSYPKVVLRLRTRVAPNECKVCRELSSSYVITAKKSQN